MCAGAAFFPAPFFPGFVFASEATHRLIAERYALIAASMMSVELAPPEKIVRDLIPVLKKEGASGIVEYPLNKVIP